MAESRSPWTEFSGKLWQGLELLCSFGPRYPGSPGYYQTRDLIRSVGASYAAEVSLQSFHPLRSAKGMGLEFQNIILKFPGTEGGKPLFIGAHYDTRPYADQESDEVLRKQPIVGANDGGSGVALLLALAEWYSRFPPKGPVHLVFFDGEDYGDHSSGGGLLGSTYMAEQVEGMSPEDQPYLVLVVDMIGDAELEIFRETYSQISAGAYLDGIVAKATELGYSQFKDQKKYTVYDDHYPFYKRGIPAIVLIDLDYPHWHLLSDTLDKCSEESLLAVFRVLLEWQATQ
ncbi:MAG: M28 family peptidase [Candidatus Nitrohelix vancouverensis]|uniref:M28 family peptidase n=1 Tax=Candidatus Nitrohelix vancouverensis TaxID=2705534 RepID=A0A7T0C4M1_9BACT|nr:MAG: M28 family peptidase [Candidatus Nitrohelix vancouverensis]